MTAEATEPKAQPSPATELKTDNQEPETGSPPSPPTEPKPETATPETPTPETPAKPVSEKKRAATRANARKSTGPRTPEGKATSRMNALQHGLLATQVTTRDGDPDENPFDFEDLLNGLLAEYRPVGATQRLLVERIAACYGRLRRALRFEGATIRDARDRLFTPLVRLGHELAGDPLPDRYSVVLPNNNDLDKLIRYETMIDRQLTRCLAALAALKSAAPNE